MRVPAQRRNPGLLDGRALTPTALRVLFASATRSVDRTRSLAAARASRAQREDCERPDRRDRSHVELEPWPPPCGQRSQRAAARHGEQQRSRAACSTREERSSARPAQTALGQQWIGRVASTRIVHMNGVPSAAHGGRSGSTRALGPTRDRRNARSRTRCCAMRASLDESAVRQSQRGKMRRQLVAMIRLTHAAS